MMISLEVYKLTSLHVVCDDDKSARWDDRNLHIVGDDDMFGSLEVYMLYVMMIGLEVGKIASLHIACDDDTFGSLEAYKFTCCM